MGRNLIRPLPSTTLREHTNYMDKSREIRSVIRKIAGVDNQGLIFFNASVVSVDDETCVVERNGLKHEDVRLAAVIDGNTKNLLVKPKVGSMVLIADLSEGLMRDLAVIGWSEVDTITINGGSFGGLVKIQELTNKLNALVQKFNLHTHTVATTGTAAAQTGTAAATTGTAQQFSKADYEDTKIKH